MRTSVVLPASDTPSDSAKNASAVGLNSAPETGDASETSDSDSPEDVQERLVEAFDAEVDKWMEPSSDEISLEKVDSFLKKFRAVPVERQEECLQRALNLVPDENVFLLAAMLFSADIQREQKELIFNDVLNRDESVKQPILQRIVKDKSHPCWTDAAWILDVTGEAKTSAND